MVSKTSLSHLTPKSDLGTLNLRVVFIFLPSLYSTRQTKIKGNMNKRKRKVMKRAENVTIPSWDKRARNRNEVESRDLLHLGSQYRTGAAETKERRKNLKEWVYR
jgi:hypothetical protein